jgi:hypothetical protein
MITYKNNNYETTAELRNALNTDFQTFDFPFEVKHRVNGAGQVNAIKAPETGDSLYLVINFDTLGSKTFALTALLQYKLLEMPEELSVPLLEAQAALTADFEAQLQAKREASRLAYEKAKQEEADKKAEAKYQTTKAKMIKDFETLANTERPLSEVDEFYYSLGWIAKNCGAFACNLPDYLLPYFQTQFGNTYEPKVVDSRKKTASGNSMQWPVSMTATIKKKAQDSIPAYLSEYLNTSKTSITNTPFIWDLVATYGFKFDKTQDIDQIKPNIPVNQILNFENGYAS